MIGFDFARRGITLALLIGAVLPDAVDAQTTVLDPGVIPGTGTFGRSNDMQLDGAGNPAVVFADASSIYLVRCNDSACSGGDDVARNISFGATDPALALDSSGLPVITYFDTANLELVLVRCNDPECRDDDETYQVLESTGPSGNFNDLVLDALDRPVVAFEEGSNGDLRLIRCNDPLCAGEDDASVLVSNPLGGIGSMSLALDASDRPVIAHVSGFQLAFVRCNDPGCSGEDETVRVIDATNSFGVELVLDASGNPVIAYQASSSVRIARCNDSDCDPGANGAESIETVVAGGNPGLALDAGGRPGFSYTSGGQVRFAQCNDLNCSGGDEVFSTLANSSFETSMRRNASGHPVITSFTSPQLRVVSCNDAFCFGGNETFGSVAGFKADVGRHVAFARQANEYFVAYRDDSNRRLRYRFCNDPDCQVGGDFIRTLDESAEVGEFADLAINGDGFAFISYFDASSGNLKVAECTNTSCSSPVFFTVDSAGVVGSYSSLAFDGNGFPVIAYHDETNGALKLARCDQPNCASFSNSIQTVDSGGGSTVGEYASLALDGAGLPVIAYYDASNGRLKLARCNDANCDPAINGPESIEVVDDGADVGRFASLRLEANVPVITYYDGASGALKLARCNDPLCVGGDEDQVIVDAGGGSDVGRFTSQAVDASLNPVIAYRDATSGDLRIAQCNDVGCAGSDETLLVAESSGDVGAFADLVVDGDTAYVAHYDAASQAALLTRILLPGFPPPPAPTGLSVVGSTQETISLQWTDPASDETGFRVERSANGGASWTTAATLTADTTTVTDAELECASSYSYRVYTLRSTDGTESAPSNTVQGQTAACVFEVDIRADDPFLDACTSAPGDCSLRGAILRANGNGSGLDTIRLDAGDYSLSVAGDGEDGGMTGDLDIDSRISLIGLGADRTRIDASGLGDRVLDVQSLAEVAVFDLAIVGGNVSGGGGAARVSLGTAVFQRVLLKDNEASFFGGGIFSDQGDVVVSDSAIIDSLPGAIEGNRGTMSLTNVTLDRISGDASIRLSNFASGDLTHVTVIGLPPFGTVSHDGSSTLTARNSIFVGPCGSPNLLDTQGGNVESPGDSCGLSAGAGDFVSVPDPQLKALQLFGGPTPTRIPDGGSVAIDGSVGCPPAKDQRGVDRPIGAACDSGAVEVRPEEEDLLFGDGFEGI